MLNVTPLSRASSLPQGNVYSDVGVSLLRKRPAWLPMIYAQRDSAFASKLAPTGAMYEVSLLTKRPAWLPMIYAQRESAFASKLAPTGAMYEVGVSLLTKRPAWPPMIYAQR
ncbi:hypothetical protein JN853_26960 [Pseudomonas syringae pv. actinidiae ICMP 9853]|uniref:Uncharacterized protein n=5 Tax=Pseudomonas syringae group TaxID=136849 RepID=A0AAU8XDK9_PSESF|nr:hypothetical protein JN853_26960 [Pseudomonas syringae pv. actinidiae ICMP 9853]ATV16262.1 hypothetical protein CT122_04545 [Pseudomonas syringae pv. actinidiae]AYL14011.1 hypothetical protein D9N00_05120 [Pseudomonas syringae pv. actinidiae]AYL83136.1 hypothetical protein CN228_27485 [Pseudomonas syringae pv. actinidiae str. Shaanxi_M228]PIN61694.1 hypothetical protein CUB86_09700 [Pseudomonas syringae pv. actinidiae]